MCSVSYQIRYTEYILKDLFNILVVFVWTEKSFQFGLFFQSVSIAGEFHCPVLHKVFTEFTHIVAVKTTGNVFCYEVRWFNGTKLEKINLCYVTECLILVCNFWCRSCAGHICNSIAFIKF
jgi:hypothetical protein